MKTQEQVTKEFTEELHALLAKYDAKIEAEDHYTGYAECGEDIRMTVSIPAIYDDKGERLRDWTEINLGKWVYIDAKGLLSNGERLRGNQCTF